MCLDLHCLENLENRPWCFVEFIISMKDKQQEYLVYLGNSKG